VHGHIADFQRSRVHPQRNDERQATFERLWEIAALVKKAVS